MTDEDRKEILNKIDQGYVGVTKPSVEHIVEPRDWPGKLYSEQELEIDEGDHLRIDEQGWS